MMHGLSARLIVFSTATVPVVIISGKGVDAEGDVIAQMLNLERSSRDVRSLRESIELKRPTPEQLATKNFRN